MTAAGSASHSRRCTTTQSGTRRPRARKTTFISALSMPTAEASTPQPTYGDVGQLEQALHRAVFAVGAVEDREDDVEARGP